MNNPTKFTWADPTTNTDPTIPFSASEITGYQIGVRSNTAAGSVPGVYPITGNVTGETSTTELISALSQMLVPDTYAAAVRAIGPQDSAWSAEQTFTINPPIPSAPTNFTIS